MTKAKRDLRNKKRRERYLFKKDEYNKIRRNKYAIAKQFTSTSKEARAYRGYSPTNITKRLPEVRYTAETKIFYIYKKPRVEFKEVPIPELTPKQLKQKARKERRNKARDLGYTPDEADYLRDVAEEKWTEIIGKGIIVDPEGRINRWARMSGDDNRSKFDKKILEECERINIEAGYDINSRYGYAVYYFWYVNGGDIEGWKGYVLADPFDANKLGYSGENIFSF